MTSLPPLPKAMTDELAFEVRRFGAPPLSESNTRIIDGGTIAEPIKRTGDYQWLVVMNAIIDTVNESGKSPHVGQGWGSNGSNAIYIDCEGKGPGKQFQRAWTLRCRTNEQVRDFIREPRFAMDNIAVDGYQPRGPDGRSIGIHVDGVQWYKRIHRSVLIGGSYAGACQNFFLSWESDPNNREYEGPHGPIIVKGGTYTVKPGGNSKHQIHAPGKVKLVGVTFAGADLVVGESFAGGMAGKDGAIVPPGDLRMRECEYDGLEIAAQAQPCVDERAPELDDE